MEPIEQLVPAGVQRTRALAAMEKSGAMAAVYGLTLKPGDMRMLAEKQVESLRATGRVEFGEGPYGRLIAAFCDSPYLSQATYAETLAALCELFYQFKSESADRWSDDELVEAMKSLFDGVCHGAVEGVADSLWQALHDAPQEGDVDIDGEEELFEEQ